MNIVIDARRILKQTTGIGKYTYQLIKWMPKLEPDWNFTAIVNEYGAEALGHLGTVKRLKTSLTLENHIAGDPWRQFYLPWLLKHCKADLFHDPGYFLPVFSGVPKVVTIHDLAHYEHPETNSWKYVAYMKLMTRLSVRNATHILTDSEAMKHDLMSKFHLSSNKITCIYLGVDDDFFHDGQVSNEVDEREIRELQPFILTVMTMEPRKNLRKLLDAYTIVRQQYKQPLKLIITGSEGWKNAEVLQKIETHPFRKDIVRTGFMYNEKLRHLYKSASVFAFPSLYEGFGLPVLEAMASGVPVVTSRRSSLPEVGGDAVLYCEPEDAADIAAGIMKILKDSRLAESCIKAGLSRAKSFTWEACAKCTLDTYRNILTKS